MNENQTNESLAPNTHFFHTQILTMVETLDHMDKHIAHVFSLLSSQSNMIKHAQLPSLYSEEENFAFIEKHAKEIVDKRKYVDEQVAKLNEQLATFLLNHEPVLVSLIGWPGIKANPNGGHYGLYVKDVKPYLIKQMPNEKSPNIVKDYLKLVQAVLASPFVNQNIKARFPKKY